MSLLEHLLTLLRQCPLVASVQASDGSAVDDPVTLLRLAQCSVGEGVTVLRLQGVDNIRAIKSSLSIPVIGLIKKSYSNSDVYITPTENEVQALLDLKCEIIALDATTRARPSKDFKQLVDLIHLGGALAMADCDSHEAVDYAISVGCDLIGTTLSGYTPASVPKPGPDFELVRYAVSRGIHVIAEGRYSQKWQVDAALRIGATGVVVGGAINDPVKQTRALLPSNEDSRVGAVDIGGTWLRFAVFRDRQIETIEKIPTPEDRDARISWIRKQIDDFKVTSVGVGTGGTVDPKSGEVWEAKPIIAGHQGSIFAESTLGVPTVAINDGLATAWGHYCHADFAGKRVATLALGTGVGAGFVAEGKIWHGPRGEYPRLNDIMTESGRTIEELLGGAALTPNPTSLQKQEATEAFRMAVKTFSGIVYPDVIVVCGSVGLSEWLEPEVHALGCVRSPYGADAGLYGSMWLAQK